MKFTKIFAAVAFLAVGVMGAFASSNNNALNRYWYKAQNGQPAFIDVQFKCTPLATGCKITSGPNQGKQLYTSSSLLVPLQPEI